MNSRQSFYSLTFLQDFKAMGTAKWYMIHTMTDETYAVNCTLSPEDPNRRQVMFFVALFSRIYGMAGTILGGLVGQLLGQIPDGIDFCMTALFVIIFIDQWEKTRNHVPALIGLGTGIICLLFFGKSNFILPALIIASGILLLWQRKEKNSRCMMRKPIEFFLIIIMCAIITFGLRALPFAIFRGERKMPVWLEQLGKELPPLIMAVLIVYCLRDIMTDPKHIGIAQMAGVLATAISYKWKHNTLLSIISGTAVYICMIFVI